MPRNFPPFSFFVQFHFTFFLIRSFVEAAEKGVKHGIDFLNIPKTDPKSLTGVILLSSGKRAH